MTWGSNHAMWTEEETETEVTCLYEQDKGWTPELQRVYDRYPGASTTKKWPDIVHLANKGEVDEAMDIAKSTERTGQEVFNNKITRKMRIERSVWLVRVKRGEKDLRAIFNTIGGELGAYVEKHGTKPSAIPRINKVVHEKMVELRKLMRPWLNAMVRDTVKIAFRNITDTYKSVFIRTQEGLDIEFDEQDSIDSLIDLFEAPKIIKTEKVLSKQATIKASSAKWRNIQKKIITNVTKKNLQRFKPSQAIWDITQRAEMTLKRIVTDNVARGVSSKNIANKIKKFISPSTIDEAVEIGAKGVYRSPFKNAMRVARTETNRAYAKASGEYAKQKKWIVGKTFHIAKPHLKFHNCDQWNGRTVSVEKYNEMVDSWKFPFHPHCVCFTTDKIADKYLIKEDA